MTSPSRSYNESPFESPSKRAKRDEAALKERLLNSASKPDNLEIILEQVGFSLEPFLTTEMKMLRDELENDIVQDKDKEESNKVYKLPDDCSGILDNTVRDSKLYVERGCYPPLFNHIMKLWTQDTRKKIMNIILTGNSGIGKSWFQVYFLRRLLREYKEVHNKKKDDDDDDTCHFRFVLRHVANDDFYLLDLQRCQGWLLKGQTVMVMGLLKGIENILYLYAPGAAKLDGCPKVIAGTPCLSTLSPNPERIKEYKKQARPIFVYMPVWELRDLELVAKHEKNQFPEDFDLEQQHALYGGIIRRTLEYTQLTMDEHKEELDKRIKKVDIDVLRSIHLGLDDNSDAQLRDNISGYIVGYTDIPQEGEDAFVKKQLMMTSAYTCAEVDKSLRLKNPLDHAEGLAKCLSKEVRDITGSNLEVSAAHMVALGPQTLKWNYLPVGGTQTRPPNARKLPDTKKDLHRGGNIEKAKLNYPSDSIYGLVDFFVFIKEVCWAFQTTWQESHAFKLSTLFSFREKIGLAEEGNLNILFVVPPDKLDIYRRRPKEKYLLKGEDANKPIRDPIKGTIILEPTKVTQMWDSTNIFVAFPEHNWESALKTLIQELK